MNQKAPPQFLPLLIWGIALFALSPWFFVQVQAMLNGNVTSLLQGASRLLQGMDIIQANYETNPPLSIILYMPHVLLSNFLGVSLPIGASILTFLCIILSSYTVHLILRNFSYLNGDEKRALLFGYIVGITIMSSTVFFAEREHFIIMALFPFILCQYALTERISVSRGVLYSVLTIGAICALIKPHYGLLPAVFLVHRMIRQKKLFSILKDPDFIALSLATLSYLAVLFFIFPDYIYVVLPDSYELYVFEKDPAGTMKWFQPHFTGYVALLLFELIASDLQKNQKRLVIFLYVCALLCLIPVFVQMKGYFNHMIPALAFFSTAISFATFLRIENWGKRNENGKVILFLVFPLVLFGAAQIIQKPSYNFPKHSEVPTMSAAKFFEKECKMPCTLLIFHHDMEIMNPTVAYMGYTQATRYPTFWFIPQIYGQLEFIKEGKGTRLPEADLLRLKNKHANYIVEDIEYYKPSLLLIATNIKLIKDSDKYFDFIGFFSSNEKFKHIIEKEYEKTGTFEFDRAEYFRGTTLNKSFPLKYDVYKRKLD